jgi:hypothetical protein
MITLTSLDHDTFDSLCEIFTLVFELYTPFVPSGLSCFERTKEKNRGWPCMIWPEDGLGLVLAWTRTRASLMVLQLIFGMTYTNLDDYLLFAKRIIVMVLQDHPMAEVQIPSTKKIEEYVEMVNRRHPYLSQVWCTMDGLMLMLEQSSNALIQEKIYNGWTQDHYVKSVMCFFPDGMIHLVFFNIPGTIHDSQVADYGDMYDKLELVYLRDGAKCTVDSAFGNVSRDFLIKSLQELIHIEDRVEHRIARDATSMRQFAELGMRAFQSSMPGLKDCMKFETPGEQRVTLTMMILLHNLQARAARINQLTSVYTAPPDCDANIEFVGTLINN